MFDYQKFQDRFVVIGFDFWACFDVHIVDSCWWFLAQFLSHSVEQEGILGGGVMSEIISADCHLDFWYLPGDLFVSEAPGIVERAHAES